jgi:PAS domain S-box-containing protein
MTSAATILLVEDNPTTRKMLRVTLATEGYRVIEAGDARAALATVEKAVPDLVLQDLILPDMDGLELLRRLRALPGGAELPIVALSGFLSRREETQGNQGGFTAFLVKPIEPSRLVEAIRAHLPQREFHADAVVAQRRLLVVDDDAVQLKLTRLHFQQLGYQVTTAGSAGDALVAARSDRPDLVLSDVFMPDTDGFQLCHWIRRDPNLSNVPVVLLSSQYGSTADQDLARRVGANALVTRTPDFVLAARAMEEALETGSTIAEEPSDQLELRHAKLVIRQLEQQTVAMASLTQRCAVQGAQLSLLGGIADALTRRANVDVALRDVLAATLDAAGISKGALILRDKSEDLELRGEIGFSDEERARLRSFFGHQTLLEEIVNHGGSVSVPSASIASRAARDVLDGARVASAQIVPLIADGRGMGVMFIGASQTDVTSDDSVAFARAMGNQVVQSLALARTVARLTSSEQRYRTLLDNANDYIAVLTADGMVREANHRWVEITGLSYDELIGRSIVDLAPTLKEAGNGHRLTGGSSSGAALPPVEILGYNGARVLVEFSRTDVDVEGERLVLTIGRDVTQQRTLEDQLRQSQKLEAVGQLAGGVAHDFNNVLTAILGFTELMLEGMGGDDMRRQDLLEIKKAAQRAAGLTQQLLAFSRKQILQPKVLDVNQVVRNMEAMLKRLMLEHINLTVSLAPNLGLVKMDPTQLEQILVNLVVNAGDAMPRGGRLTIETGNVTLDDQYRQGHLPVVPGEYVMLAVTDTGVGMDEDTTRRIFEPFFTTKGVGQGTGLGLSTVYGIVKQSGGFIYVYSEVGRGSTFKIYLPQEMAGVAGPVDRPSEATELPRGSETVLLVEDDEGVRLLVKITLERLGYRVLEAGNPKEAAQVASAADMPIELLLSDVIMPESDGPPLYDRLIVSNPAIRVLYMSGYADEAIVRHGVLSEGTPFLQKPFTSLALARKIRSVLETPLSMRNY